MKPRAIEHTVGKFASFAATWVCIAFFAANTNAAVIINNVSGSSTLGGSGYEGHSFTIPAGTSYNNITFSWLAANGVTPLAAGDLFLLSQEYLGAPANLSSATPGFMDHTATITTNAYVFNPATVLSAAITYWVYMGDDASLAGGGFGNTSPYAAGQPYERFSGGPTQNFFSNTSVDFNFKLQGSVIPEPSRVLLSLVGIAAIGLRRRRS